MGELTSFVCCESLASIVNPGMNLLRDWVWVLNITGCQKEAKCFRDDAVSNWEHLACQKVKASSETP